MSAHDVKPGGRVAAGVVLAYQWTLRPLLGGHCRFYPSCSDYAIEALHTHGALGGSVLAARRVLRCNPWNEAGFDPVPPPRPRGLAAASAHEDF